MQGCKAYRLCSVAVLNELGKGWWIDMKNVQISEELFVAIIEIFYVGTGGTVASDKTGAGEETGCNGNERIVYKI